MEGILLSRSAGEEVRRCRMIGVPTVRECLEDFQGTSAHAFISEMKSSGILPCRKNGNNVKSVANLSPYLFDHHYGFQQP